ncbi:MAG: dihydroorotate dehydrogenase [Planctomycetota bacterium]|jgi:dihydroorotate dehydrogenase (NAD+) catalytic subunit
MTRAEPAELASPPVDLSVPLGPLRLQNPVLSASGTFGYGPEIERFFDPGVLGAIVGKSITLQPREGNPSPRMTETAAGMLNAIGLQNPGLVRYRTEVLPRLLAYGAPVIVNVAAKTVADFCELAARMSETEGIAALELNLSCPNVKEGGLSFSADPLAAEEVCRRVRAETALPFFAKLTPNTTDIVSVAKACEQGGATGVTAINTLIGMAVDWRKRRPVLANRIGGLSGPAIKPVALRMVNAIAQATSMPILAAGGARTAEDVLDYMVAGASAVQIGTATFVDPLAIPNAIRDLKALLRGEGVTRIETLIGTLS